jgi:quercetin dioxygenase-like cupin family protein
MSATVPIAVQGDDGERIRIFGGIEFVVKVAAQDSGGAFSLLENINPPGTYLPPHIHTLEDETFYILDGEFEFQVGDQIVLASSGATVYAPRHIPHSFKVLSSTPGRALVFATPAGFEKCMRELSALPLEPPDMGQVLEVCARYGMEFLPPPTPNP